MDNELEYFGLTENEVSLLRTLLYGLIRWDLPVVGTEGEFYRVTDDGRDGAFRLYEKLAAGELTPTD